MIPYKKQPISGWGNYPSCLTKTYRPEALKEISAIASQIRSSVKELDENNSSETIKPGTATYQDLQEKRNNNALTKPQPKTTLSNQNDEKSYIFYGNGKSYGDAALNKNNVILTTRLNRFINFNTAQGIVTVEPGVTLAEIMEVSIPQGWLLPVIPGTKYATIGGCVASNIHGKNHFQQGDLSNHLLNIKLVLASGETIDCSPTSNVEIFRASCGGMGMTGFIAEITLKLMPISSCTVNTVTNKVNNIDEMLEQFRSYKDQSDYMVGWIDHFAKDKNIGRGIFESATHVSSGSNIKDYVNPKPKLSIPFFMPSMLLNKYSMAVYNDFYFRQIAETKTKDFGSFFHPLDNINNWNRLYGKRGLLQYQFILPEGKKIHKNLNYVLNAIHNSGIFSFLAVIKYHRANTGLMNFSFKESDGYSIALDFPVNFQVISLLTQLDEVICQMGGKIYLAKDVRLSRTCFEAMYGKDLSEWKDLLKKLDPEKIHMSVMAERLGFKDYE